MATQTKAYVATNQLRGRVMRIDPNDDFKTASIWHIIATAPDQRFNKLIFENLKKRFRTFAGLHAYDLKIESGTERIQLRNTLIENENNNSESTEKKKPSAKSLIQQNNETMQTRLKDDLFNLQARWQNALAQAKQQVFQLGLHHAPHDNSSDYSLNRLFDAIHQDRKRRTKLSTSVGVTGLFTLSGVALLFDSINTYILGAGIAGFGALSFGIIDKVTGRKNLDTLEISKGIARTILTCLHSKGMMKTELLEDSWDEIINIRILDNEVLRFSLSAYTRQENEMFLEVLNEFLQPLSSGRYLLVLKDKPSIQDLFTIPKLLGNNKKDAEAFLLQWKANFPEFKKAKTIKSNDMTSEKLLLKASAKRLLREEMLEEKIQMIETWE